MVNLFKKLAITDRNDLSKTEVISNIAEGVDGATAFGYDNSYDMITIEDMQQLPFAVTHTLETKGLPTADVTDRMDHFNDPDTETLISAIGVDGALISLEPIHLEWIVTPSEGAVWNFRATAKTLPHREPDTGRKGGGVHVGENILATHSWADSDGDGIANGFSSDVFSTSFSGGVQTLTHSGTDTASFSSGAFLLPFTGEQLTYSVTIDSLSQDGHSTDLRIEFYDSNDSLTSTQNVGFSTTGRKSVSATIPENAVMVRFTVASEGNGNTSTYEVSDPCVTLDGSTEYRGY